MTLNMNINIEKLSNGAFSVLIVLFILMWVAWSILTVMKFMGVR